jgi:site-specific recombinase XerC
MKTPKPQRGLFEKIRGSGTWWIRYTDSAGRYRREKVGAYGLAEKLLARRRGEAVTGIKLPETLRRKFVSFVELADDAIAYVKGKYARPATDVARLELLKGLFAGAADTIKPKDIKRVLDALTEKNHWSPSTKNHYQNLVSLAYRLGIENEKVEVNPARAVRREKEDNNRVRFLTPDEEKKLRDAIRSKPQWAEHEVEFDLALHTGLRRSSMYIGLVWENVNLVARAFTIPHTSMKNDEDITLPVNVRAGMATAASFVILPAKR